MVRTINTHLSNFIPSCLLPLFLSLSLSYFPLPSFIYFSFAFPLFIFTVCFIYFSSVFLLHFHITSLASFPLSRYLITPFLH
jgi:hypothetical protein